MDLIDQFVERYRGGEESQYMGKAQMQPGGGQAVGGGFNIMWVTWSSPGRSVSWNEGDCAKGLDNQAEDAPLAPLFHSAENLGINLWSKGDSFAPPKTGRSRGGHHLLPTVRVTEEVYQDSGVVKTETLKKVDQCQAYGRQRCKQPECACAPNCVEWVPLTSFVWYSYCRRQ
jgi:hypothetical protein